MSRRAESCGLTVEVESGSRAWRNLVDRALGDPPRPAQHPQRSDAPEAGRTPDVVVRVESSHAPFQLSGLTPLTRGAWGDGRRVVLADACGSGLDLLVEPSPEALTVTARSRPGPTHRALRLAAPGRTELLWRAALLQYPTLWWAAVRGAVPLHVSAARVGDHGVVLAGPGGVGKSTLLGSLAHDDGAPVSDNLCTYDGERLHGLPEPRRVDAGTARALRRTMPHGRVEQPWEGRQHAIRPSLLLVLRRGTAERPTVRPVPPAVAARALVAGTYAAGELRRYWAFSATLALGTGLGPAHPAIVVEAERLARSVPCLEVMLPARPGTALAEIVDLCESTVAAPSATTEFVAEAATKAATETDRHRPAVSTRMTGVQG
ncbi:hypothetical protein [Terrabacter sp. 2YAF2]|uniref:hypothetical protein n=1 Tax=Terrabacter sp. 2YAF2 TaxID=3233026 RepID=UPI003F972298